MPETTLLAAVTGALRASGDPSPIRTVKPIKGGFTSKAARLTTRQASYLLKWYTGDVPDLFVVEARNLQLLRDVGGLSVPNVITAAPAVGGVPGFMLQEWVETQPAVWRLRLGQRLGASIAAMHLAAGAAPPPAYGLDFDNYFGSMPQSNRWDGDWVRFFRECRLRPQVERAERRGLLPVGRREGLEQLMERLDSWLGGVERRPALLHGDLWGGNVLCDTFGAPVLIDPCLYYGDREAELAYTEPWGDFPLSFYRAYEEVWPTAPDCAERRDLYNLYHFLGGLNSQGEIFGARIDAVIRWYVGG
jgi:fructosamine-3-kinase